MSFDWSELPDIIDVYKSLQLQADLKAKLKAAKLSLEIYQAELCREKPRDTSVKLIGIDEQSRAKLEGLFNSIAEIESQLDKVDAEVKFNNSRIDAAKVMGYKGRI